MSSVTIRAAQSFAFHSDEIAPDKSISHRSAMFATLADGTSVICNFLRGEDTMNTLRIVQALGAKVEDDGAVIRITSQGIIEPDDVLDCGNSGTGMRLFCGLLASAQGHFVLSGDAYLRRRPMKRVTGPLRSIGAMLDGRDEGELAPLSIRGGSLKAFDYTSPIASAQVKSAMILAALHADGPCTFEEPELSRDHTERMLAGMGAQIRSKGFRTRIVPLEGLLKPLDIRVPADPSSAFFFAAAAAIIPGGRAVIEGVTLNPTRIEAFRVLERMGADVRYHITDERYEPIGSIEVHYRPLKAVTVETNIAWLIDELPALAVVMATAQGISQVKNASELRVKESDRITTVVTNLQKCGIICEESDDGYRITGGEMVSADVESYGDHRIAMSFIIAGLRSGMKVNDVACIQTSFPNFMTLIEAVAEVKHED